MAFLKLYRLLSSLHLWFLCCIFLDLSSSAVLSCAYHLITSVTLHSPLNSLHSPRSSLQCSTNKTWSGQGCFVPWFGIWPGVYNFLCAWVSVGDNGKYAETKENVQVLKGISSSPILEIYILLGYLWCVGEKQRDTPPPQTEIKKFEHLSS